MKVLFKIIFYLFVPLMLFSCSKVETIVSKETQKIEFKLLYQGKELSCSDFEKLNLSLLDMRFFIHDLSFGNDSLDLIDTEWQSSGVALLDFENTKRQCEQNNLSNNDSVQFSSSITTGKEGVLSFTVGLPNNLNHQNPVKAPSPLNRSDMHWQWLSGYKFLRLEYIKNQQLNRFHLGSMGCSGRIPNDVTCNTPNTLKVNLADFEMGYSIVQIHLDGLVEVESEGLCMGNPNDEACDLWIEALSENTFRTVRMR